MVIILITNKQLLLLQQECNYLLIMWVVACLFHLLVLMLFRKFLSVFSVLIILIILNQYKISYYKLVIQKVLRFHFWRTTPSIGFSKGGSLGTCVNRITMHCSLHRKERRNGVQKCFFLMLLYRFIYYEIRIRRLIRYCVSNSLCSLLTIVCSAGNSRFCSSIK